MVFSKRLREPVMNGDHLQRACWQRLRLKVGGRYRLSPGAIHVTCIPEIGFGGVTPELTRRSGFV